VYSPCQAGIVWFGLLQGSEEGHDGNQSANKDGTLGLESRARAVRRNDRGRSERGGGARWDDDSRGLDTGGGQSTVGCVGNNSDGSGEGGAGTSGGSAGRTGTGGRAVGVGAAGLVLSYTGGRSAILVDLDAGAGTAAVSELVAAGGVVVGDLDSADQHVKGALGQVNETTSPFDSALRPAGLAADPVAQTEIHWGLGEVLSAVGSIERKSAHRSAIDEPSDALWLPVNTVGVPCRLRGCDIVECTTVVGRGVALAEVVALSTSLVVADPFLYGG